MEKIVPTLSVDEFADFLKEEFDADIADTFERNKISGSIFLQLSENQIARMVPAIGDIVKLQSLRCRIHEQNMQVKSPSGDGVTPSGESSVSPTFSAACITPSRASSSTITASPRVSLPMNDAASTSTVVSGSNGWIQHFQLPHQFSLKTMKALKATDKAEITNSVRCEIISSLATLVMVHTMYPTTNEFTTLCDRLVTEYPILADGYGCGYTTWRNRLREKFKNMRKRKRGLENEGKEATPPAAKKPSRDIEKELGLLKKEMSKSKPKSKVIGKLMDETEDERRRWIQTMGPSANEIVMKYPSLRAQRWVRREFERITALEVLTLVDDWKRVWEPKILSYGDKEASTSKALAKKLSSCSDQCSTYRALTILEFSLYPRSTKNKQSIVYLSDSENIEEVAYERQQGEPYIIVASEGATFHIIIDGTFMYSSNDLASAMLDILCFFYNFDMEYPKNMQMLYLFLQQFVLGLKDNNKIPSSVISLYTKLQ